MLSSHIPQIRISLSPGEALDPGLKKEISQQVREFRAQKLSQRGRSPGHAQNPSQAAGQGHGAAKSQTEAVSQSNKPANSSAAAAAAAGDKPRDRPVSVSGQAAQLKAVQPHPQSPRQGPSHRPGSEPASAPVSTRSRCRSHSPRYRIDVDVDEHRWGGQRGMRSAASHQDITLVAATPSDPFSRVDPLSQSFPDHALQSALSRCRPSGPLLQVPDTRHFLSPALGDRRGIAEGGGSASVGDLRASALTEVGPPRSLSSHRLQEACWGRPPSIDPQSPLRSSSSCGSLSPDAAPYLQLSRPPLPHLNPPRPLLLLALHDSPAPRSRCSPTHSPFGSQKLIDVGSLMRDF